MFKNVLNVFFLSLCFAPAEVSCSLNHHIFEVLLWAFENSISCLFNIANSSIGMAADCNRYLVVPDSQVKVLQTAQHLNFL